MRGYVAVFGVLIGLTALTVGAAFADLGAWSAVVALAIASTKAVLVALYFMHVRWARPLVRLAIAGGVLGVGILLVMSLSDFATRGRRAWDAATPARPPHFPQDR